MAVGECQLSPLLPGTAAQQTSVSIALCTYQGAPFIEDQLQSLLHQTRLPNELVVCDDSSTDATAALLGEFAATAPFPVRIRTNATRLGVAANFSRAISLCTGSVVALCDQDDVWVPTKLESQISIFQARSSVGAVFSDAELVDRNLRPAGRTLFEAVHFSPSRQRRFQQGHATEILMARPVVCGATLAFRSSYRSLLLPIPTTGVHDIWLSVILSAVAEVVVLPEPLLRYRQHGSNQIGSPARGFRERLVQRRVRGVFGDEVAHYRGMVERLASLSLGPGEAERTRDLLRQKVDHLRFRNDLPSHRSWSIARELASGRYHQYSRGLESAAYDLLLRDRKSAGNKAA